MDDSLKKHCDQMLSANASGDIRAVVISYMDNTGIHMASSGDIFVSIGLTEYIKAALLEKINAAKQI